MRSLRHESRVSVPKEPHGPLDKGGAVQDQPVYSTGTFQSGQNEAPKALVRIRFIEIIMLGLSLSLFASNGC